MRRTHGQAWFAGRIRRAWCWGFLAGSGLTGAVAALWVLG
jgi:hypothetical protein